jgi:hypothetical protein
MRSIAPHTQLDRDEKAQLNKGHGTLHSKGGAKVTGIYIQPMDVCQIASCTLITLIFLYKSKLLEDHGGYHYQINSWKS